MLVPQCEVNRPRSGDDQGHDGIGRLMHDVHDAAEAFVVHGDTGQRIGCAAWSLRMKENGIRFVARPRLADRLPRPCDGGCLRGPVFPAVALGLQRVVAGRNATRLSHEPVLVGAEFAEITLSSVNMHRARRAAVVRIVALDDHADPTFLRALWFFAGIRNRSRRDVAAAFRREPARPTRAATRHWRTSERRRTTTNQPLEVGSGQTHQKLCGTSIWSPGKSAMSKEGLARTALTSIMRTCLPRRRRTLRWSA